MKRGDFIKVNLCFFNKALKHNNNKINDADMIRYEVEYIFYSL
jgi:hypothetical protein